MITKSQDDISDSNTSATDAAVLWERDIAQYVWQESPNDVPKTMWGSQKKAATHCEQESGLTLKARVCTPAVQRQYIYTKMKYLRQY